MGTREIGIQEVAIEELDPVESGADETTVVEIAILERGAGTVDPVAIGQYDVRFEKGAFLQGGSGERGIVDVEIHSLES